MSYDPRAAIKAMTGRSIIDPDLESTYAFYARSDFTIDGSLFYGSVAGSAVNDIVENQRIKFTSNSDIFTSSNLVGTQVKTEFLNINKASARLYYESGYVETPTLSISRDGGNTYNAITDSLITTNGNIVTGDYSFGGYDVLTSGIMTGITSAFTGVMQQVTPAYDQVLSSFDFYLGSSTSGTNATAYIYTIAGGVPNTLLYTFPVAKLLGTDITSTQAYINFQGNYVLQSGVTYGLAVTTTGAGTMTTQTINSSAAWAGSVATYNGTSWTPGGGGVKYAIRLYSSGVDLRLKIQSSGTYTGNLAAESHLKGFGVDFVWQGNLPITGDIRQETHLVSATEASSGLINLSSITYTPGASQLVAFINGHAFMAPQFTEISPSQVQFTAGSFTAGSIIKFTANFGLLDGSSIGLGKVNTIYEATVGSSAQVTAGYAQYTSLQAAITAVAAGGNIFLLNGNITENITIAKEINITGKGRSSLITGTCTLNSGASYCTIMRMKFTGNVVINSGANGNFFREIFLNTGSTVTNSGTANSILVITE